MKGAELASPPVRQSRTGNLSRVWVLTVLLAVVAWVGTASLVSRTVIEGAPLSLPWWIVAPVFFLVEATVVKITIDRRVMSISLVDVPIVMGLYFVAPADLVVGAVLGATVALVSQRRQAPEKLGFNFVLAALRPLVAVWLFRSLASGGGPLEVVTGGAAVVAAILAGVVAQLLIAGAVYVAGGRVTAGDTGASLQIGVLVSAMSGALALGVVHLVWLRPASAPIALLPPLVLYLAYRAYVTQRQERTQLGEVYEATRELHRIPQIDQALVAVTGRARTLFEADIAKVVLFPEEGDAIVTVSGPGDGAPTMARVARDDVEAIAELAVRRGVGVVDQVWSGAAMAAPLLEDKTVIGAFLVMDPVGEVARFGSSELKVLETLASQVSVTLENGRLEDSLARLTRLKEELHRQALHDGLTGLANRRRLLDRLGRAIATGADASNTALLFLDLDDFKVVNDTDGHQAGDELLRMVADRLLSACRAGDTVARIGGDEFAVLLVDLPRPREAEYIAERVLELLNRPFQLRGRTVWITASLGVAHLAAGIEPEELIRRADQSMYAAKWSEKGTYQVFADSTAAGVFRWMELRADLRSALADGGLEIHHQPVVDLQTGSVVGMEALLRWDHPRLGQIAPSEVLSVAEDAGIMAELGRWTLRRALADLVRFRVLRADLWVSVNFAVNQVEPRLPDVVSAALRAHSLHPSALMVEITEATATQISEGVLEEVSALGVRIALDDFGTGYSSFARLDRLPIDVLKIDRSFVARLPEEETSPLLQAIVDLGHTLGLSLIAEGVETEKHRRLVLDSGCRLAQGWLTAPALPPDEMAAFLNGEEAAHLLAAI